MLHLVMVFSILVMTPVVSFGEFIQQALQDLSLFRVNLVHNKAKLFENLRIGEFNLVVIDLDLESEPAELLSTLYSFAPDLYVIALMEGNSGNKIATEEGMKISFLQGLFHFPIFLETLENAAAALKDSEDKSLESVRTQASNAKGISSIKFKNIRPAPIWLQDVQRTAHQLARLSIGSSAHAALITRNESVWAYSGQLSQSAAEELARSVWHSWSRDGGNDFAQYTHLEADNGEYMLYATGLGGDFVLALAFILEIPFSMIRSQAINLAQRLTIPPQDIDVIAEPDEVRLADIQHPDQELFSQILSDEPIDDDVILPDSSADWDSDPSRSQDRFTFLERILSSVVVPDPDGIDDVERENFSGNHTSRDEHLEKSNHVENGAFDQRDPETNSRIQGGQLDEPIPDHLMDTQPTPVILKKRKNKLEEIRLENLDPVDYARHNLTYACILLPRLPQHHLVGELSTFLNRWVVQLCLAFGWRLEHLAIRPNYFHWVSLVHPVTSPAHMVQSLREHLSQRIFVEFPRLESENPSGDFWAPGYLIINGRDPLSYRLLDNYINEVRIRQGLPQHQTGT